MTGFLPTKVKRKDLEDVNDEFSEFSLNSPARKIRRLDADLPPIMEEEDPSFSVQFEKMNSSTVSHMESLMPDAEVYLPTNEERGLVLYKPMENPLVLSQSSANVSFRVHSDLVDGLKRQVFWYGNSNTVTIEELPMGEQSAVSGDSLAVVPWVPCQASSATGPESRGMIVEEPMEAEEAGCTSMEVEEDIHQGGREGGEGFHQWPQHCMTPQVPQNTSTPVMWSWDEREGSRSIFVSETT